MSNPARGRAVRTAAAGVKPALLLGALGVVYGDIGTSPLYAFKEAVKAASAGGRPGAGGGHRRGLADPVVADHRSCR